MISTRLQEKHIVIFIKFQNYTGARVVQWVTNTAWVRARLCKLQKGCIRLAAASDKVYQLLTQVVGSLRVLRLPPPLKLVAMI